MTNPWNNLPLFGRYITMSFCEVWPNYEAFAADFTASPLAVDFGDSDKLRVLFYLLYAKYGSSHIASMDLNQFKYQVFSLIHEHGLLWARKLELQEALRELTDEEILISGRRIVNHALNPSTEPSTDAMEALPFINEQTASGFRKNRIDGYMELYEVLHDDFTERFLGRFRKLFISIVFPQAPLWYISENGGAE